MQTTPSLHPAFELIPCGLCGSKEFKIKYPGRNDLEPEKLAKNFTVTGTSFSQEQIVTCTECGLTFTSPRLKDEIIVQAYKDALDPEYLSQAEGRLRTFRRIWKEIQKISGLKTGSVLDVGAAGGFFLQAAKEAGWKTYGIEPSQYLADFGNRKYGVGIQCGTLETTSTSEKFDVITLFDVLEHTSNPKKVLLDCSSRLKPDGLIVISYPNIGSWPAKLAGRHFWFLLSVHLYYFTPKTLKALLASTGFQQIEEKPHIQWLEIGYLFFRLETHSALLGKLGAGILRAVGLSKLQIPYFAGQTRVIARKISRGQA